MRVLGDLIGDKPDRKPESKPDNLSDSKPEARATSASSSRPDADFATVADPNASDARRASVVGEIPLETKRAGQVGLVDRVDPVERAERVDSLPRGTRGTEGPGGSNGSRIGTDDRRSRPPESPRTRTGGGAWFAIFVLALALAGVVGYGYLTLRRNNMSLAQLPGMAQLTNALGGRMDSVEARLGTLTANWTGLADKMKALDGKVTASLYKMHEQTTALLAEAEDRMRAEMDRRAQVMDARLDKVESTQADDKTRLAQVEENVEKEVAGLRQEMAGNQDDTAKDLAALHNQVDQGENDTHTLARQITQERVNFEATRNSTVELAPGVQLTVLKTDVSYQRFEGYVSLTGEGRTLWLRNAGMRQAVSFYTQQTDRPYDLVVTGVNRDGVVGYLLVPAGASQG